MKRWHGSCSGLVLLSLMILAAFLGARLVKPKPDPL
jgi:hypothetical protein